MSGGREVTPDRPWHAANPAVGPDAAYPDLLSRHMRGIGPGRRSTAAAITAGWPAANDLG
jgi:hypothetical protein